MSNRSKKIAEEIKREMTDILRNEINDPRIDAMISVTSVDVTRDLSYASIYVSKLGDDSSREEMLEALQKASGFIRSILAKRLTTRTVPEIIFKLDNSLAYGNRIEELLHEIEVSRPHDH